MIDLVDSELRAGTCSQRFAAAKLDALRRGLGLDELSQARGNLLAGA